jgi:cell wall-associated NlpC family hydrolase
VTLVASPLAAVAEPTTPAIEQKRSEAAAAQAELDRMSDSLEVQIEEYNRVAEALDATREQIRATRADLQLAERELSAAQTKLAERATNIYKQGPSGMLDVLLGTTSFEDFMTRFDLLMRINRADARMVAEVKVAKTAVEATERTLTTREAEQVALKREAETRAEVIETEISRQEGYLASLEGEIKQLIDEEQERQRKLAEERARQVAERARQAAARAVSGGRPATPTDSLTTGHSEVVQIALGFLGVPYRWGASSPSGFDCSGLTSYVYRQVGITLPRTSRDQYRAGSHIAADRLDLLRAGDLVFFGTGGDANQVHHVGIYIGNGQYVHAPQQNDVVKISSLTDRISSRGDYVGASRF